MKSCLIRLAAFLALIFILGVFAGCCLIGAWVYSRDWVKRRHDFLDQQQQAGITPPYVSNPVVIGKNVKPPYILQLTGEYGYSHIAVFIPDQGRVGGLRTKRVPAPDGGEVLDTQIDYVRAKELFPEAHIHAYGKYEGRTLTELSIVD